MFQRRQDEGVPDVMPERVVDERLRDEVDPDPLVEEAVARLRAQFSELTAVDAWGRPVAWRLVARVALGPLATPRVRDAVTAEVLAEHVEEQDHSSVSPDGSGPSESWRALFGTLEQQERLL